jgi:TolB protein
MSIHWYPYIRSALIVFLGLMSVCAHAQLNIEIFGGGASRIPIAIVPFAEENKLQQSITPVIGADLQRTGLFKLVDPAGLSPHAPVEVVYADWVNPGANALVIGRVIVSLPGDQVEIQFRLMDVAKKSQLTGLAITVPRSQLRAAAHRIADVIYEALTGDVGVFSTRIAYVIETR